MKKILLIALTICMVASMLVLPSTSSAKTAAQKEIQKFKSASANEKILYGNGAKLNEAYKTASKKLGKPLKAGAKKKQDFFYENEYAYKNGLKIGYIRFEKKDPLSKAFIGYVEGEFKNNLSYKDLKAGLNKNWLYKGTQDVSYCVNDSQFCYVFKPTKKITKKNPITNKTLFKKYSIYAFM